jgi:hypothetical protein
MEHAIADVAEASLELCGALMFECRISPAS